MKTPPGGPDEGATALEQRIAHERLDLLPPLVGNLRDTFACYAMQALLGGGCGVTKATAVLAYTAADLMLEVRKESSK